MASDIHGVENFPTQRTYSLLLPSSRDDPDVTVNVGSVSPDL